MLSLLSQIKVILNGGVLRANMSGTYLLGSRSLLVDIDQSE